MTSGGGTASYALRNLRYWFMEHLLRLEHLRRQRSLAVLEVGVGHGQLLIHMASACGQPQTLPRWIHTWDAVDRHIDPGLKDLGYQRCIEIDVEADAAPTSSSYDVVIVLHLLEHLSDPETALARLVSLVKPGGMIIGGGPTLPDWLRAIRESRLRRTAQPYGHVSVISCKRLRQMAGQCGLSVEFLTGGYFIRATGGKLERSPLWTRFNLLFGACCPSWPGEHYWQLRKNTAPDNERGR